MAKSKKNKVKSPRLPKPVPLSEVQETDKQDNPFDFGGLPDRDLKKNLGCG